MKSCISKALSSSGSLAFRIEHRFLLLNVIGSRAAKQIDSGC